MKDNFSNTAEKYANFRPSYPAPLIEYIANLCDHKVAAWDCGTGNGQVAMELCKYFQRVFATDISQNQIDNAYWDDKITYEVEAAESCSFPNKSFDLITIAQAIHWFDFDLFYEQVRRTIKPKGLIAIIAYGLIQIDDSVDTILKELYTDILGSFWDPERKMIDEQYKTIPFPFTEMETPSFSIELNWTLDHLMGYLHTWSAVEHYQKSKNAHPILLIKDKLKKAWGKDAKKQIQFPIYLRLGKA